MRIDLHKALPAVCEFRLRDLGCRFEIDSEEYNAGTSLERTYRLWKESNPSKTETGKIPPSVTYAPDFVTFRAVDFVGASIGRSVAENSLGFVSATVVLPDGTEIPYEPAELVDRKREAVLEVLDTVDREDTAEHMAELLMDDQNSTWKMFETLASMYLRADEKEAEAIEQTCAVLTGWSLTTIASQILEERDKAEDKEME